MTNDLSSAVNQAELAYQPYVKKGSDDPYHGVFPKFVELCSALPTPSVLELGAREVNGVSRRGLFSFASEYVGMDIYPGPGVDITGDIHDLAGVLAGRKFDAIYSFSVFEHLAFPWKAVLEINRSLKMGGLCFVSTHPVWPPHELPWDFWRFPLPGLRLLFSAPLGFRVLVAADGLPGRVHSMVDDPPTRALPQFELPLGVAVLAEKIADYDNERIRWDIPLSSVLDSSYPVHA